MQAFTNGLQLTATNHYIAEDTPSRPGNWNAVVDCTLYLDIITSIAPVKTTLGNGTIVSACSKCKRH